MGCTHDCNNGRDCKCEEVKRYIRRQVITMVVGILIIGVSLLIIKEFLL